MGKQHRHKAAWTDEYGYSVCVNPGKCDPRAHGGVVLVESCRCGATRQTLRNGPYTERGEWKEAR